MAKTFIIAEGDVNHNGSMELAKQLIDVAVEAGANAVKFQTFFLFLLRYIEQAPFCWMQAGQ